MSAPYPETLCGEVLMRLAPDARHEAICNRLHACIHASVANLSSTRLLPPRSRVQVSRDTILCPDLTLVTVPHGKAWLAAEIINSGDNRPDTVIKKQIYEELRIPRLWMIDPRYDNVEIYQTGPYGLCLKEILAGAQVLSEKLIPEFEIVVSELFKP